MTAPQNNHLFALFLRFVDRGEKSKLRRLQLPRHQRRQPIGSRQCVLACVTSSCRCGEPSRPITSQPPECRPSPSAHLRRAQRLDNPRPRQLQLLATCLAAQLAQPHPRFPSPNPQPAERAHPRLEEVCLEALELRLSRQEACLATQGPRPRPRRQHPRQAHHSLDRPPAPHLGEIYSVAVPSRQGACLATARPPRRALRRPQGHQACSAIRLPQRLLPPLRPLRQLPQVVFSGVQLPHHRLPRAQLRRQEDCLATLAAPCLAQPLLPLGRPALRRHLRSHSLGGLAPPRRPARLRPITPSPPDLCSVAA